MSLDRPQEVKPKLRDRNWFRCVVIIGAGIAFTGPAFKFFLGAYLALIIIRLWDLA